MKNLSVITINLNNGKGLEKTIKSVLDQTYIDFEYIIIDGGSEDNSRGVIEKYSSAITHWISEKDAGIYNAMNKGINLARGRYCLFLNSGDLLYDEKTLANVFAASHEEDILYGNIIFDYLNGNTGLGRMPRNLTLKHMIRSTLWHPGSFIKRNLLEANGLYNERFSIASDYDFFLKAIYMNNASLYYLDITVAFYRFDGISSLPSSKQQLVKERREIQLQYFSENKIEKALKKSYFQRAAYKLKHWKNNFFKN